MIFFSKKSLLNTILSHYEKDQGNKEPPAFSPQLKFLKPTVYQQAEFLICPCRFPTFGFNGILPGSVFPHQLAISKHHQSPSSREALRGWGGGGENKNKTPKPKSQKTYLFYWNKPRKSWPWFISEKEIFWDTQLTCCLCNLTSLRSCSTSIFSFSFSGRSSMWRAGIFTPEPATGAALEVERLDGWQTLAPPEITALLAHPACAGGDCLPGPWSPAPRRRPLTPALPSVPRS